MTDRARIEGARDAFAGKKPPTTRQASLFMRHLLQTFSA
ncbi:hypothetical protein BRPE64_BCDS06730 [Caballeronia insecticola]|uniref:Uncharacterized protein n=1 Tax=Caballeronia insecticola TaxID=758793 RepID=R4WLI6_9BURK|nr:hypothetical protein BRPE64_BCDS06730 [Caballeronia insecticola]